MEKAYFGKKVVEKEAKEPMVQQVFTSVAEKYDLMNDMMSLGLHRKWKHDLVFADIRPDADSTLLDCAGGTGDIANLFLEAGGKEATVLDLNPQMVEAGKAKYPESGINWVCGNAQALPYDDETFDFYTISFGLRNVTDIPLALSEGYRVLKKGGKFLCMEFSPKQSPLVSGVYDLYSRKVIPALGKLFANDSDSYVYLEESIKGFLPPERLALEMKKVGFSEVSYRKLSLGILCVHEGYKL